MVIFTITLFFTRFYFNATSGNLLISVLNVGFIFIFIYIYTPIILQLAHKEF